jgi:hypothetical protein
MKMKHFLGFEKQSFSVTEKTQGVFGLESKGDTE